MQRSHYIKAYPCEERPGHRLLYSTRRASLAVLKEETYRSIERGTLSPSDQASLIKLGMLVPDREEEKRATLDHFHRIHTKNPTLHLVVVLNLDCNFACPYCYEGDMKGKLYMSDETAARLVDFIEARLTDEKKTLLIDFHGGEPLLSTGLIRSLSRTLKSLAESRGAAYGFTLVTNGSLLRRPVAEELAQLGLQTVKITLDGPAENHNRQRPFKSGAGSFDTIIRNIQETWDLVRIGIGGNFTRDNYQEFVSLLDTLERAGLGSDKVSVVKFDPVTRNPDEGDSPVGCREGCSSINEPWLWDAERVLREEILRRGYNTPKPMPMHCMIENRDSYVVNFDGVLYKCPAFIGRKGFDVGDLRSGPVDAACYRPGLWKNEVCAECEYLPLCFGGCRYLSFVRDGKIDRLDCRKEYLDASLETLIKQDRKYRPNAVKGEDGRNIDVTELTRKLGHLMAKHFPRQFPAFKPPTLHRIIASYHHIHHTVRKHLSGKGPDAPAGETAPAFVKSAFLAVAAMRCLDDFIDNIVWPEIPKFDPVELPLLFETFLQEALDTTREFDPDMPRTVIDLPRLEMYLALHPDQASFDRNFTNLLTLKSLNLSYVYRRIHGDAEAAPDLDKLRGLALIDYIRDFSAQSIAGDTGLNLYKHIRGNQIDPRQLLHYLKYHYKAADPAGFRKAEEDGSFTEVACLEYADGAETGDPDVPLPASFSRLYGRAIHLLQELL